MAYMRGDYYLWDDESGLHIWAADGYDGWDVAGWHVPGEDDLIRPAHLRDGRNVASGVSIPQEVMDEYVMMRLAQMIHEGAVEAAIDRATAPGGRGGNIGGMVLAKNAERLKRALRPVEMEPAPPYNWDDLSSAPEGVRSA